jgi:hypothetical protein
MWVTVPVVVPVGHSIVLSEGQPYDRLILRPPQTGGGIELCCEQIYERDCNGNKRFVALTRVLRSSHCQVEDAFHVSALTRLLNPKWSQDCTELSCEVVVPVGVDVVVDSDD